MCDHRRQIGCGHGGSHGNLTHEFICSILENREPLVNIYEALALTVPGIITPGEYQRALGPLKELHEAYKGILGRVESVLAEYVKARHGAIPHDLMDTLVAKFLGPTRGPVARSKSGLVAFTVRNLRTF